MVSVSIEPVRGTIHRPKTYLLVTMMTSSAMLDISLMVK